ncbi:hypothetical protein CcaverHIS631_0200660 [Cutaneotrichosporon cavernicola]|nr:hypothetical protein CcaverHIS631_0200660 [Cutaneotrichosporon cavernicola]
MECVSGPARALGRRAADTLRTEALVVRLAEREVDDARGVFARAGAEVFDRRSGARVGARDAFRVVLGGRHIELCGAVDGGLDIVDDRLSAFGSDIVDVGALDDADQLRRDGARQRLDVLTTFRAV